MPYVLASLGVDPTMAKAERVAAEIRRKVHPAQTVTVVADTSGIRVIVNARPGEELPSLPDQMDGVPIKVVIEAPPVLVASPYPSYYPEPYYGGPFFVGRRHGGHHRRHHP